jgi:uncharacterized protein HemX
MIASTSRFEKMKSLVASFLVVAMLAGCVTTPSGSSSQPLTPEEERLRAQADDFNVTVSQAAIAGAVIGGVLGALLNRNNRAKGAAVGVMAGGALGAAGGYYVAQRKQAYANEQARLDGMINDVDADNQRLTAFISNTRSVIAKNKAELEEMERQIASGQKKQSDKRALLAKVETNRDTVADALKQLRENEEQYQLASNQMSTDTAADTSEMDAEIRELSNQISQLETQLDSLNQVIEVHKLS